MSTPLTHSVNGSGAASGFTFSGRTNIGDALEIRPDAPLVIALHGGTYSSEYFDIPGHSLLDIATERGIPVIALDRPNYVDSTPLTIGRLDHPRQRRRAR